MSTANTTSPTGTTLPSPGGFDRVLGALQSIGRSLMLPIAVLPAAALLLRLGQPDLLNLPWMAAAGNALFLPNLAIIFAVGIAIGWIAALGLNRFMGAMLVGVKPADPSTFAAMAVLFVAIAAVASWIPARRAARIDPTQALRQE